MRSGMVGTVWFIMQICFGTTPRRIHCQSICQVGSRSARERRRNRMPSKMTHGPRTHPLKTARAHALEAEYPFCWNANTAQPGEDKPFVQFRGNAVQLFIRDGATYHGQ